MRVEIGREPCSVESQLGRNRQERLAVERARVG